MEKLEIIVNEMMVRRRTRANGTGNCWHARSEALEPKAKGGQKSKGGGKGANAVKTCWNCGESGHMSSQCPKKKVHVVE